MICEFKGCGRQAIGRFRFVGGLGMIPNPVYWVCDRHSKYPMVQVPNNIYLCKHKCEMGACPTCHEEEQKTWR